MFTSFHIFFLFFFFFFQAEDGIRDLVRSRGLGDVYKRQLLRLCPSGPEIRFPHTDTADIGRNDGDLLVAVTVRDVLVEDGGGEQIVRRDIEEPLYLASMEIHGQHPVSAGRGDQIGDQLGGYRCAGT
eukprot:TRINITY_DN19506_c0_g1_i1.p1 TRINITY_DN19506_c0_g1~~TRINITY_DN19506_c0_g1_i1.p1  ORF type:complete len:128 (-),score=28.96 TRINITY_DN19506_c0_g1_i1:149-532(-)